MRYIKSKILNNEMQTGIVGNIIFGWEEYTAFECRIIISEDKENKKIIFDKKYQCLTDYNKITIDPELKEQEIYYYELILDNHLEQARSAGSFITGLKSWNAKWITNNTNKPFYARKTISLNDLPQKAIISVCGLGQFDLKINGKTVSNDVLKGAWTDFNKHIMYYTYDIADLLKQGDNEIFAEIANGWFIGDTENERHFYTLDKGYKPFGNYLAFICELNLGDKKIVSNEEWQVLKSATTLANIYGSEDYDNQYFQNINNLKWEKAVVLNSENKPKGSLVPVDYPPVIIKHTYHARKVANPSHNTYIFDAGQNMSGMFEIEVKGRAGAKIKVTPVEKLNTTGNIDKTTDTWSVYTLSGQGIEKFCPKFSYVGARWVQIENCTVDTNDNSVPQIISVKGHFITSAAEDTGYFRCSNENYNKIFDLILKAVESNLNHCHTDCPTIEKLGWLEPNHLMAKGIMYCKNVNTLWSKIAMDIRDSQYTENDIDNEYNAGFVPNIAPRYAKFLGSFWDSIPWGSSIILAAWEQYMFYGNIEVLKQNYPASQKYIEYMTNQYNLYEGDSEFEFICSGLGDWGIEQNKGNCRENVETAFYYHDLDVMSKIADILGEMEDSRYYANLAENVKENYNKALLKLNPQTGLWCYDAYDCENFSVTQPNQAMPLCFGMVPDEYVNDVRNSLETACADYHFHSGEIGLVYVIRALSDMGRNDIIHKMMLQDEHPSYIRFVNNGETTLPEFWRDDARSRNHDMMGHILEWFFEVVGGIKSYDGFKSVVICSELLDWLDWVECSYKSINGLIYVKKQRGHKPIIKTPDNIKVIIC